LKADRTATAAKRTANAGKTVGAGDGLTFTPSDGSPHEKAQAMAAAQISHAGLDALLTPEESVLVLIDHQAFQFANMHSHEPQLVVGNVLALARTAKVFGVPTILTTVLEERGGYIIQGIQDEFPDQKPINRTFINAWQDQRLVEAVRKTGRRKLVMAGLWTEVCVAMPALQAQGENYDVYAVTDASGGVSVEAHAMAVQRMVQAGIKPITWLAVLCEWQRDWARQETIPTLAKILMEHGGGSGVAFSWEAQLLKAAANPG
jgi:nicotinamidase-related amidase